MPRNIIPLSKSFMALFGVVALTAFADPAMTAPASAYSVTNLVSDLPGLAANTDTNLANPWGLLFDTSGALVVADNHADVVSFYLDDGTSLDFNLNAKTTPTGIEVNTSTNDFKISSGANSGPASLIVCTEAGTILGFNGSVDLVNFVVAVDRSSSGTVYKGMTLAKAGGRQYLYAADFHNGKIDAFDRNFNYLGSFTDPHVEAGFAPFNIRNIGGWLYVTFAKQLPPGKNDDLAGPGNGFVDIFSPSGFLIKRLVSHGKLNSPWGLALAPGNFGQFSNSLLVGNFGDGTINAYHPVSGKHLGTLSDNAGIPIVINGLWSLKFAPTPAAAGGGKAREDEDDDEGGRGDHGGGKGVSTLYFSAGINHENDGLVGTITPAKPTHAAHADISAAGAVDQTATAAATEPLAD